jgi:hypothetical protein
MLKEKLQLGKYLCCKDNVTDRNTERGRKKQTHIDTPEDHV